MTKNYKKMIDEIINKMDEDAPANSTGVAIAGTGDDNTVHTNKSKLIKMGRRDPLMFAKPKTFKQKIKESDDNNNILLKGVLDKIDSIEVKIDELTESKTQRIQNF